MGNPFGLMGIRGCPRAGSGFGCGAVWLWCLRVSVSVHGGLDGTSGTGETRETGGRRGLVRRVRLVGEWD